MGWMKNNVTGQEKDDNMRGKRERGLQASGAGHEINLEIEDVLDKKNGSVINIIFS